MKTPGERRSYSEYNADAPKVSVIIPVYNAEKYISECLDSLRAQTLKDLEFIFVDDKSSDRSMDIVEQASMEDARIRILYNKENIGPGPSRNRGIDISRGEYLNFLDSDDYVDSDFYETLYKIAKENDADVVKGHVTAVNENGCRDDSWQDRSKSIEERLNIGHSLYRSFVSEHFSALFRRSFITEDPGLRYGSTGAGEDSIFLLKASLKNPKFCMSFETEYYHRIREGSLEENITFISILEGLKSLVLRIGILGRHSFPAGSSGYIKGSARYYIKRCRKLNAVKSIKAIGNQNRKKTK